ncbi:Clp protease N-terminal domain-containing protein [Micromonospora sp. WMMD961]|uniref:Clp protease N-terminal domain-containing protein n=1 Tax=Micromonospora sp. WMMD961 TaxID=3016100 RepID=UPI002417365D|nr:Clp protease N-terminal domain-containing protein [Micromonospora sp. WMMD961]MDG4783145.1 Clp protease N-terminal domain-containing protein [Micromonospora sp. WMMD961]
MKTVWQPRAGRELTWTLAGAAGVCWRDGRDVVDTSDVAVELTTRMMSFKRLLGRKAKHLGGVASDIPSEAAVVESSGDSRSPVDQEVEAVLREAMWNARRDLRYDNLVSPPLWSSAVHAAVRNALGIARTHGVRYAHGMHLLGALIEDPACRASVALANLGICGEDIARAVPMEVSVAAEGTPVTFTAGFLAGMGVLNGPGGALSRRLRSRVSRLILRSDIGLILPSLDQEAIRQTVRMGAAQVDSVGVLAAVLSLDEQLAYSGRAIAPPWAAANAAGEFLAERGLDVSAIVTRVAVLPQPASTGDRTYRWRSLRADPPFGAEAAAVTDEALRLSGNGEVGTSHLVLAMLTLDDCAAQRLLRRLIVLHELRRDLTDRLVEDSAQGGGSRP